MSNPDISPESAKFASQIVGALINECNQPLAHINGFLELALEGTPLDEDLLKELHESAQRMATTLRQYQDNLNQGNMDFIQDRLKRL